MFTCYNRQNLSSECFGVFRHSSFPLVVELDKMSQRGLNKNDLVVNFRIRKSCVLPWHS